HALSTLCKDNIACLRELAAVINKLDDDDYRRALPPCNSGIGAHVRHVLDHYDALLGGLSTGSVDYDCRERDTATQLMPRKALQRIDDLCSTLARLTEEDLPEQIAVVMDCGSDRSTSLAVPSTPLRELQFLVSHTVHHDALIAASVRQLDVDVHDGYGVAPSTLRFSDNSN
ncbi:MAG: DinB family protein, partial [Pseudomonadota bacterium]